MCENLSNEEAVLSVLRDDKTASFEDIVNRCEISADAVCEAIRGLVSAGRIVDVNQALEDCVSYVVLDKPTQEKQKNDSLRKWFESVVLTYLAQPHTRVEICDKFNDAGNEIVDETIQSLYDAWHIVKITVSNHNEVGEEKDTVYYKNAKYYKGVV